MRAVVSPRSEDLVPVEDDLELIEEDDGEQETPEQIAEQIAEASADLARLAREAAEIGSETAERTDALVPTGDTAKSAKTRLAVLRADATKRQMAIHGKQQEIKARQREIEDLMHRQMALAEETLAPLQKYVAQLEEGIWMVNLYLGRNEEIVVLADGEPAGADEQVVIRQLVLAMDEECAINPDEDGIDATNIGEFDAWLQADPAHVDQVIPEQKAVVALRPRFRSKRYEDPWKQQAAADADKQTYFLIRNGGKLYRTWTEFNVGERLVPNADEFSSFFFSEEYGGFGKPKVRVPITPGTLAWERAEEAADERKRHFMRVALILQGLVDRTTVFHPLPEGGISFTDFEHNGKTWRFLLDAEMALGTGRQPFYEWLAERNAQLRVGMRIVGSFTRTYDREDSWGDRIRPRGAERPPSGVRLTIEDQQGDSFVVRYKRSQQVWDRWRGYQDAKVRASCLIEPDDRGILPFDLVTEDEMLAYLNSRLERHAYSYMFPLLRAAIRAKREEREEEAPFRTMLAGVLARENAVEVAEAEADTDSLVEWWKLTNKHHRPLVGTEESQAKAVRMIVAEHRRRLTAKRADAGIVHLIRTREPDALLVARKRDGKYVALVPEEKDRNVFVREIEFSPGRKEQTGEKRWTLISKARVARWDVAYTSERFEGWDFNATLRDHLTGPEFASMVKRLTLDAKAEKLVAVAYHAEKRRFYSWRLQADATLDGEHPMSGAHTAVKVEEKQHAWERNGRSAVLGRATYSHRPNYSGQRKPWDTRSQHGGSAWYGEPEGKDAPPAENKYLVVYHDRALDARVEAERARYKAVTAHAEEMRARVRGLLGSVEAAWVKRREAVEYQRFLEDFVDPELWEGHKKTLPRETFEYPHSHFASGWGSSRGAPDALGLLVSHAVESGIDLAGMTVWEAAMAHFPSIEECARWLKLDDWYDSTARLPEPIDIPADVRDFRFVEPVAEPDEDPWDDEE